MIFAEGLESWYGRFDHGNIVGSQDDIKDFEDIGSIKRKIPGSLFDQGSQYLKGNLDIPGGSLLADMQQAGAIIHTLFLPATHRWQSSSPERPQPSAPYFVGWSHNREDSSTRWNSVSHQRRPL